MLALSRCKSAGNRLPRRFRPSAPAEWAAARLAGLLALCAEALRLVFREMFRGAEFPLIVGRAIFV
jgi:hypothetical protein